MVSGSLYRSLYTRLCPNQWWVKHNYQSFFLIWIPLRLRQEVNAGSTACRKPSAPCSTADSKGTAKHPANLNICKGTQPLNTSRHQFWNKTSEFLLKPPTHQKRPNFPALVHSWLHLWVALQEHSFITQKKKKKLITSKKVLTKHYQIWRIRCRIAESQLISSLIFLSAGFCHWVLLHFCWLHLRLSY